MMEKQGFAYIMASRHNGTLYIGVTSDLPAPFSAAFAGAQEACR